MWFFSPFLAKNGLASTKFGYFDKSPAFSMSIRSYTCMSTLRPIFWQLKTLGEHCDSCIIPPIRVSRGKTSINCASPFLMTDQWEAIRGPLSMMTINPDRFWCEFIWLWTKVTFGGSNPYLLGGWAGLRGAGASPTEWPDRFSYLPHCPKTSYSKRHDKMFASPFPIY